MKKTLLLFCVTFLALNAWAQKDSAGVILKSKDLPTRKTYNNWSVGVHTGLTYSNTDIAASDFNGDYVKRNLAYGFHVTKSFTHNFSLQGYFLSGTLRGEDKDLAYKSKINYQVSLNAMLTLGNISFLKKTPNLNLYGYFGFGFINVDPEVKYKKADSTSVLYKGTTEQIVPFGIGIKYRVSKRFVINADYSFYQSNSDKIDGYVKNLSELDNYSYLNVGLTYIIGKKDRAIEWINPLQSIYADLYDVKDKVDRMTGDSDDDGVADMFDKEPNTPPGVKVYGDGTSVDIDKDGVPDYKDVEPFSNKGAKVDADGRELDEDGDGVPDSQDLEPTTPKGNLVNFQGKTISPGGDETSSDYNNVNINNAYFPSVFFDLNSAVVSPKYNEMLATLALVLMRNPGLKFEIQGNCDVRASEDYNINLGKRRAEAVRAHLLKKYNISADRLTVVTKGKKEPITKDHAMNRRVDFTLTAK